MVILFEALRGVSLQIVDAGGVNLAGIAQVDPVKALIYLTGGFMALAYLQVAHALLCAIHALPFVSAADAGCGCGVGEPCLM